MPLYEYECKKCGHRFEKIQKFSDPHETKCPQCGGKLEQVISAPAVQFKGSGWYVTDYGRKGSSSGSSSRHEGGSEKTEASAEKSDSKPKESKSESKPHKKK